MPLSRSAPIAAACMAWLAAGAAASAETPTYSLTIKDHQFQPGEIEVPAGTKIKLLVTNADPTAEEFESDALRREKVIAAGTEGTIYVGPLEPGIYEFYGDFNPKTARGRLVAK